MAALLLSTKAVLIKGDDLDQNEVELYSEVMATGEKVEKELAPKLIIKPIEKQNVEIEEQ